MVYKWSPEWVTHIGIYGAEDLVCKHAEHDNGTFFTIAGQSGGLHLRVYDENSSFTYGGLEFHYPVDYKAEANQHENCWLLGRSCEYHGSSLIVEEILGPLWGQIKRELPNPHRYMLERLLKYYVEEFDIYNDESETECQKFL